MKTVKFVAYLFYRYYSRGRSKDIAYFSTLCALAMLIFVHFLQIVLAVKGFSYLHFNKDDGRGITYLKSALLFIPVVAALFFVIKERDLKAAEYAESKVKRGGWLLITYMILSIGLMFYLMAKVPQNG
jgi:glucan phosphoethanolaminetransferase (alkaline phosphatase superfamily)